MYGDISTTSGYVHPMGVQVEPWVSQLVSGVQYAWALSENARQAAELMPH